MKETLIELIYQLDSIEKKFHCLPPIPGFCVPSVDEIYDIPEYAYRFNSARHKM